MTNIFHIKTKAEREAELHKDDKPDNTLKEGHIVSVKALTSTQKYENQLNMLAKGMVSVKELIAPPSFELHHETYLMVGSKYVRSYYLQGYPKIVYVTWMDYVYNSPYDIDVTMYIDPISSGQALQELTNKITSLETSLEIQTQKGSIKELTTLQDQIAGLTQEKRKLERSVEKMFSTQLFFNLYADSKDELERESRDLQSFFSGKSAKVMALYMRQDKAYKSTLPYGKTYITDEQRNADTGQIAGMFPFYNSELNHIHGVKFGINEITHNDIAVDFYDRTLVKNSNINVFGASGQGKTYFVSLLTLRSIFRGIRTVIIDPENEFYDLTAAMGGADFEISTNSKEVPNPFDVEPEEVYNKRTKKIEQKFNLNDKITDLQNLIAVMFPNITDMQMSLTGRALRATYESAGFKNDDVRTLYVESQSTFNEKTHSISLSKQRKDSPTFSDFLATLSSYSDDYPEELKPEVVALSDFQRGQACGMFDTETSPDLINYQDMPIVTFDISNMEDDKMRPIALFVVMQWTWEKFGKKLFGVKKRVVIDEAWMLLDRKMAGSRYTSKMLEIMSRRFRKQNGGLLCASQNFLEFTQSQSGLAVLHNAYTSIFFGQSETDYQLVASYFKLTDGQAQHLLDAKVGHFLIKVGQQSAWGRTDDATVESQWIDMMAQRDNIARERENSVILNGSNSVNN